MDREEYLRRVRITRATKEPRSAYEAYAQMLRMNQHSKGFQWRWLSDPRNSGLSTAEMRALDDLARSLGIEVVELEPGHIQ